jgi:hypothetical protein
MTIRPLAVEAWRNRHETDAVHKAVAMCVDSLTLGELVGDAPASLAAPAHGGLALPAAQLCQGPMRETGTLLAPGPPRQASVTQGRRRRCGRARCSRARSWRA